jgi:hypothetical protein
MKEHVERQRLRVEHAGSERGLDRALAQKEVADEVRPIGQRQHQ